MPNDFDGVLSPVAGTNAIRETYEWHRAVAQEKERVFGRQDFLTQLELSRQLIREETVELDEELARLGSQELRHGGTLRETRAAAAKEAADVLFVVMQAMHTLGIPFEQVYAEVLRSNWSKLSDGRPVFDGRGKLLKGAAYSPANVEEVLERFDR